MMFELGYPVESRRITQLFGNKLIINGENIYAKWGYIGHNGIDFASARRSNIFVCDTGIVAYVGFDPAGYGNYIRVKHSWGVSYYAHLSSVLVSIGDEVEQGLTIGKVGSTGASTGPHLHFGIKVDGFRVPGFKNYIDPLPYMKEN